MFELSTQMLEGLPQNGPTDPIEYYRKPLIGRLFLARINYGLSLLGERRFGKALEVGYAAGAVQLALAQGVSELHGLDLDADVAKVTSLLRARDYESTLVQGSVYAMPYETHYFDLVTCFSVFEHLTDYQTALTEVFRVLRPGGQFLLGMPAVNRLMEAGFYAIGFKGIDDHHVTTPSQVVGVFEQVGFKLVAQRHLELPFPVPLGLRLYNNWLLERT